MAFISPPWLPTKTYRQGMSYRFSDAASSPSGPSIRRKRNGNGSVVADNDSEQVAIGGGKQSSTARRV
jgi:hypothetical protein